VIFVDSNVLIDIFDSDPRWSDWSVRNLDAALGLAPVAATQVVLTEVGPRFDSLKACHGALTALSIKVEPLTDEAAFAAGQAFREYRRTREGPKSILADFLIGGQAAVSGATILTRDSAIYARYFPTVPLIAPA
jgi:predicted nucleic acid-binding protein